jgi:hypothetical protein
MHHSDSDAGGRTKLGGTNDTREGFDPDVDHLRDTGVFRDRTHGAATALALSRANQSHDIGGIHGGWNQIEAEKFLGDAFRQTNPKHGARKHTVEVVYEDERLHLIELMLRGILTGTLNGIRDGHQDVATRQHD